MQYNVFSETKKALQNKQYHSSGLCEQLYRGDSFRRLNTIVRELCVWNMNRDITLVARYNSGWGVLSRQGSDAKPPIEVGPTGGGHVASRLTIQLKGGTHGIRNTK